MNLEQARAIVTLYDELIQSIPREKLSVPAKRSVYKQGEFSLQSITIEDQLVVAHWSHYLGCGESDHQTTYHDLAELFD